MGSTRGIWSVLEPLHFPTRLISSSFTSRLECINMHRNLNTRMVSFRIQRSCLESRISPFAWMAFSIRPWSLHLDNWNDICILPPNSKLYTYLFICPYAFQTCLLVFSFSLEAFVHNGGFAGGKMVGKIGGSWCEAQGFHKVNYCDNILDGMPQSLSLFFKIIKLNSSITA